MQRIELRYKDSTKVLMVFMIIVGAIILPFTIVESANGNMWAIVYSISFPVFSILFGKKIFSLKISIYEDFLEIKEFYFFAKKNVSVNRVQVSDIVGVSRVDDEKESRPAYRINHDKGVVYINKYMNNYDDMISFMREKKLLD